MTSDAVETLQRLLGDRYTIERELGRGSNAVVYLAHDLKHDRPVALKILSAGPTGNTGREHFLREIQLTSKLAHPHIVPVYDSGELGEALYYVMPYVHGGSLRDRLKRERVMSLEDTLSVIRDVAGALTHAHAAGILHRDVKPENILFADDLAVVSDFGVARALAEAGKHGAAPRLGFAVGTPEYMSPEQATGSERLDARSDLYSLACVAYEMLAGHPPFAGANAQEVLSRHALDPVPRLAAARPDIPRPVELALRKALAKTSADRFATVAQFAGALEHERATLFPRARSAGVALAICAVVVTLGAWWSSQRDRGPSGHSVAVLPFANLSANAAATEYFSDGISEEIINALSQTAGLDVAARASSFHFKDKDIGVSALADSLGVGNILTGTVTNDSGRVRVTVQLVNARTGFHIWSEKYDRSVKSAADVLRIQEDIARTVAGKFSLAGSATSFAGSRTKNLQAYDLYLKGRHIFWSRRDKESLNKAASFFAAAIAEDSTFALAYSGLADTRLIQAIFRFAPRQQSLAEGEAAARRAVRLSDDLAEAHTSLGRALYDKGAHMESVREFERALELNPRYVYAHSWMAFPLTVLGRTDEGIQHSAYATQIDPYSAVLRGNLGNALVIARRGDDALVQYQRMLDLEPNIPLTGYGGYLNLMIDKGRYVEALDLLSRTYADETHDAPNVRGRLGYLYARQGNRAEAEKILEELLGRGLPRWAAVIAAALGRKEEALRLLDMAVRNPETSLAPLDAFLRTPLLDSLRSDPRFERILERSRQQRPK